MRYVWEYFYLRLTSQYLQILNAGAWARGSERVTVSLPLQLEDYIPEVEEFYKKKHSGRKLLWYHHMSNGTVRYRHLLIKFYPHFLNAQRAFNIEIQISNNSAILTSFSQNIRNEQIGTLRLGNRFA